MVLDREHADSIVIDAVDQRVREAVESDPPGSLRGRCAKARELGEQGPGVVDLPEEGVRGIDCPFRLVVVDRSKQIATSRRQESDVHLGAQSLPCFRQGLFSGDFLEEPSLERGYALLDLLRPGCLDFRVSVETCEEVLSELLPLWRRQEQCGSLEGAKGR